MEEVEIKSALYLTNIIAKCYYNKLTDKDRDFLVKTLLEHPYVDKLNTFDLDDLGLTPNVKYILKKSIYVTDVIIKQLKMDQSRHKSTILKTFAQFEDDSNIQECFNGINTRRELLDLGFKEAYYKKDDILVPIYLIPEYIISFINRVIYGLRDGGLYNKDDLDLRTIEGCLRYGIKLE